MGRTIANRTAQALTRMFYRTGRLDQPVVFFGSEGALGVVARDLASYLWLGRRSQIVAKLLWRMPRPACPIPFVVDPPRSGSGPATEVQARLDVSLRLCTFHGDGMPTVTAGLAAEEAVCWACLGRWQAGWGPPQPPHNPHISSKTIPESECPRRRHHHARPGTWRALPAQPKAPVSGTCTVAWRPFLSSAPAVRRCLRAVRRERQREAAACAVTAARAARLGPP
jgi:hypothetical protein